MLEIHQPRLLPVRGSVDKLFRVDEFYGEIYKEVLNVLSVKRDACNVSKARGWNRLAVDF